MVDLGLKNGFDVGGLLRVRRSLDSFDVHHFHVAEWTIMLGSLACRGKSRVYTHRGGVAAPSLKKTLLHPLIRLLLRRGFDVLSANTRHAARAAAAMTRLPVERWSVTYNGMDFDALKPKRSRSEVAVQHGIQTGRRMIIGTTAHLRALKRIDLLLDACARLPPDRYQVVIVGDGPDRQRLESKARELGIEGQTCFVGMQKEVADYLAVMDVFVLPSGPRESFGNSIVEAMAVGLPVAVFADGGGLVEHVEDNVTGFVVDGVPDLAQRLERCLAHPELRAEIGRRAAAHARTRYTLANMVGSYDRLYEAALGARAADARDVAGAESGRG